MFYQPNAQIKLVRDPTNEHLLVFSVKNVRLMGPITDLCSVEFMFAIFHVITRSYKHRPISGRFARGGILQYIPVKKLITPDS